MALLWLQKWKNKDQGITSRWSNWKRKKEKELDLNDFLEFDYILVSIQAELTSEPEGGWKIRRKSKGTGILNYSSVNWTTGRGTDIS